jgi:hypothetical protein
VGARGRLLQCGVVSHAGALARLHHIGEELEAFGTLYGVGRAEARPFRVRTAPMKTETFVVDAALLNELGERLVGRAPIALAELIKNAYDADASVCRIEFREDEIVVWGAFVLTATVQGWP